MAEMKEARSCRTCKHGIFRTLGSSGNHTRGLCTRGLTEKLPKWPKAEITTNTYWYGHWNLFNSIRKRAGDHGAPELPTAFEAFKYAPPISLPKLQEWIEEIYHLAIAVHHGLESKKIKVCNVSAVCELHQKADKSKQIPSLKKCLAGEDKWGDTEIAKSIVKLSQGGQDE